MHYRYGEFAGEPFPTPDSLWPYDKVFDFILAYGDDAVDALNELGEDQVQLLDQLMKDGLLEKVAGRYRLTPRAVNQMQRRALMEIFANLPRTGRDGHPSAHSGAGADRLEGTRPYQFGDAVSELDLHQSLRNALADGAKNPGSSLLPIQFNEDHLEMHLHEGTTNCALCILIDMSGSMMRYGRFIAAKKVAMGLSALVQQSFPQDTVDIVGFYSTAKIIRHSELPLLMPKPVSTNEYSIQVRIQLKDAEKTHQHFTNLQMGMQLGRQVLNRRSAAQKIMFIITDGQPTAHLDGQILNLIYPPSKKTALATLREALLCVRSDIRVANFALIEDYWDMEWVQFTDQLTRLARGVAFYCTGSDLASCVMESYLSGRRKKAYIS
jgi:Ca-activated chloride channel family protein